MSELGILKWYPYEYKAKKSWSKHEDKALIMSWGLTSPEEICEAFLCRQIDLVLRVRQLGLMPSDYKGLYAEHIEKMAMMLEGGMSETEVAEIFGLPDHNFKYIQPRSDAITQARREIQDFDSKLNIDQIDLFGEPSA
jgi:hypothetical protein